MTNSSLQLSRAYLALAAVLGLAGILKAQSPGSNDRKNPVGEARPTIPPADRLVLLGQVSTAAEAKPLIEQYHSEQERLFQERRAVIESVQGKTPLEQLQAMQALVVAQQERRRKNRELETRIGAMLKQDREDKRLQKATAGNGR